MMHCSFLMCLINYLENWRAVNQKLFLNPSKITMCVIIGSYYSIISCLGISSRIFLECIITTVCLCMLALTETSLNYQTEL